VTSCERTRTGGRASTSRLINGVPGGPSVDPRLLLADEPTGPLDSDGATRALDLLASMREHHGMTVLVVSHDPAVARRADRVVQLVDGRVV